MPARSFAMRTGLSMTRWLLLPAMLMLVAGCGDKGSQEAAKDSAPASYVDASTDLITEQRLINADKEPGN